MGTAMMRRNEKQRNSKGWQNGNGKNSVTLDITTGKVPPQARDIEEAVLGAILLEAGALDTALDIFHSPDVFYAPQNRMIYEAIVQMTIENQAVDMLTLCQMLNKSGNIDQVGGAFYISQLTKNVASTAHIEAHCRILWEKYIQRELIEIGGKIIHNSFDPATDVFDLIDGSEQMIFSLTNGMMKQNYEAVSITAIESINRIAFLREHDEDITGVPTGYPSLDRITYGWQPGDLIILAARPSVGKTALALNLARNASKNELKTVPVGFFSLEMSKSQLTDRLISSDTEIFLDKIRRGKMSDQEFEKCQQASEQMQDIYIDDTSTLTIFEFRSKARKMVAQHGVGLIVIDYLQLMHGSTEGFGNREQEISMITRNLKSIARELNIPIIALSQMSRDIEKRKGAAQLSDLRESGAIEQDADMVIFISRDDYQQNEMEKDPLLAGNGYLDIRKHRNGELDKLTFKTDLRIQKWFEFDKFREYQDRYHLGGGTWKKLPAEEGAKLFIHPDAKPLEFDMGYDNEDVPF